MSQVPCAQARYKVVASAQKIWCTNSAREAAGQACRWKDAGFDPTIIVQMPVQGGVAAELVTPTRVLPTQRRLQAVSRKYR